MPRIRQHHYAGIAWVPDPREPLPLDLLAELGEQVDQEQHYFEVLPGGGRLRGVRPTPRVHRPRPPRPDDNRPAIVRESNRNILLPLATTVTARIVDDTAKVTVSQLFSNATVSPIARGSYTFPLPNGCTITDFCCRLGSDKIIQAKISPKQEAHETFDRATRNNQTAGLLEQDTPEIFSTSLGNIPANTKLKAEISFVTLLKHRFADDRNTLTFTIPTYIAARYGDPPPNLHIPHQDGFQRGLTLEIELAVPGLVPTISSKSHPQITVEPSNRSREFENWEDFVTATGTEDPPSSMVKLRDSFLDKDFILDISTQAHNGSEEPHAWMEIHPNLEHHRTIMFTIPPNLMLGQNPDREDGEVLFVADRSGSMEDKMESLKSAMAFFLKGIPVGRNFNIWCFGTGHT